MEQPNRWTTEEERLQHDLADENWFKLNHWKELTFFLFRAKFSLLEVLEGCFEGDEEDVLPVVECPQHCSDRGHHVGCEHGLHAIEDHVAITVGHLKNQNPNINTNKNPNINTYKNPNINTNQTPCFLSLKKKHFSCVTVDRLCRFCLKNLKYWILTKKLPHDDRCNSHFRDPPIQKFLKVEVFFKKSFSVKANLSDYNYIQTLRTDTYLGPENLTPSVSLIQYDSRKVQK